MAKKIKDTDYLAISARIRGMENTLLTKERMEQILDARSHEEVNKILEQCGYSELDPLHPEAMDEMLLDFRKSVFEDLTAGAPDTRYIDIFKLEYDYHNAKSILKAQAVGVSPDRMLVELGCVPTKVLQEAITSGEWNDIPQELAAAVQEAQEVLNTTRDPQLSDIVLDRRYYRHLLNVAEATESSFLEGYVQTQIDAANLRALVRTLRMGKNETFLAGVLVEGGQMATAGILKVSADHGAGLAELYASTTLAAAAAAGVEAMKGGPLIDFEKLCSDAVAEYLSGAQFVPFGEAPLVGYLAARATEFTNLRILLMGRATGLPVNVIRARLRASSV